MSMPPKVDGLEAAENQVQRFRLYVSSASPVSARAVVNARKFFELHLPGMYSLEIMDIAQNVPSAKEDQVVASPTLIRMSPAPQRRFIGDMSNTDGLLLGLGLHANKEG
jgi:circadian clock protein KaiB